MLKTDWLITLLESRDETALNRMITGARPQNKTITKARFGRFLLFSVWRERKKRLDDANF